MKKLFSLCFFNKKLVVIQLLLRESAAGMGFDFPESGNSRNG
jgi:hypothetical protein